MKTRLKAQRNKKQITKKKGCGAMPEDRGALPEEERDLITEFRAVHEENFFRCWLKDDKEG